MRKKSPSLKEDLVKGPVKGHTKVTAKGTVVQVGGYYRGPATLRRGQLAPKDVEKRYGKEILADRRVTGEGSSSMLWTYFGRGSSRCVIGYNQAGEHVVSLEFMETKTGQYEEPGASIFNSWVAPHHRGADVLRPQLVSLVSKYGKVFIDDRSDPDLLRSVLALGKGYKVNGFEGEADEDGGQGTLNFASEPEHIYVIEVNNPTLFKSATGWLALGRRRRTPTIYHRNRVTGKLSEIRPETLQKSRSVKGNTHITAQGTVVVVPDHSDRRDAAKPKEKKTHVRASDEAATEPGNGDRPVRRERKPATAAPGQAPDRGQSGGGNGSGGTARGILTARADLLPEVDLTACPQDVIHALDPDQVEGVARCVTALDRDGGFIMADGTGVGKTRQILAVAKHYHDQGLPVLIVAPADVIKQDWASGQFYGSYQEDGEAVGILPTLLNGGARKLGSNEVGITTYTAGKRPLPEDLPENTVVIFDEAHNMKNSTGGQPSAVATWGCAVSAVAGRVVYASATPMDKAEHLPYLFRAGVCEGGTIADALTKLGLQYKVSRKISKKNMEVIDKSRWVIRDGVKKIDVAKGVEELFDRLTAKGNMLKREVSLDGLSVDLIGINVPEEARDTLERIEQRYISDRDDGGEVSIDPMMMAIMLQSQRRHLEPYKIGAAAEIIKQELNEGRSVAVFCARVNDSEDAVVTLDDDGKVVDKVTYAETAGTAKALREVLKAEGINEIAELHGGATTTSTQKKAAMDEFQSGRARVLITTVESGGTGINLDDRVGDAPRTLLCLTTPFTAPGVAQMVGRVMRRTTVSDTRVKMLFSSEPVDQWNARIANDKLAMLGASVKGAISDRIKLDQNLIDWLTDDDMPYTFYNPEVKVARRTPAATSEPKKPATASGGAPAPTASPKPAGGASGASAAAPSAGAVSGDIERTTYTTNKGKVKPVIAFPLVSMSKEDAADFKAAFGWSDKGSKRYLIADKPENVALVERITGQAMKKSFFGLGRAVLLLKSHINAHTRQTQKGVVNVRSYDDARRRRQSEQAVSGASRKVKPGMKPPKVPMVSDAPGSALESAARKKFGTTDSLEQAGFILSNGDLLKMDGHEHMDVQKAWEKQFKAPVLHDPVHTFMVKTGACRVLVNYKEGNVNLIGKPTAAQLSRVRTLFDSGLDVVNVDLFDRSGHLHSDSFEAPERKDYGKFQAMIERYDMPAQGASLQKSLSGLFVPEDFHKSANATKVTGRKGSVRHTATGVTAVAPHPVHVREKQQEAPKAKLTTNADRAAETEATVVYELAMNEVVPDPHQHRELFDAEELQKLAESIKSAGLNQPISVYTLPEPGPNGEKYQIIAGERRWRAHNLIEAKTIRAVIRDDLTPADRLVWQANENLNRAEVTPMEENEAIGQVFREALKLAETQPGLKSDADRAKWAKQWVCAKTGQTDTKVMYANKLVGLPVEVKQMIHKREITATHGFHLSRMTDNIDPARDGDEYTERRHHQVRLARKFRTQGTSLKEAISMVSNYIAARAQLEMFETEEHTPKREKERQEQKKKVDRLTEELSKVVSRTFDTSKGEIKVDMLTDGDLWTNIKRLEGAMQYISELKTAMEQVASKRAAHAGILDALAEDEDHSQEESLFKSINRDLATVESAVALKLSEMRDAFDARHQELF